MGRLIGNDDIVRMQVDGVANGVKGCGVRMHVEGVGDIDIPFLSF